MKSLHIVPSLNGLVCTLALLKQERIFNADIVLTFDMQIEEPFYKLIAQLGANLIDFSAARENEYLDLYTICWFSGSKTREKLSQLKFTNLFLLGDGNRNSLYPELVPLEKLSGYVFFEFELEDEFFNAAIDPNEKFSVVIIDYNSIAGVLCDLKSFSNQPHNFENLQAGDLLLLMRYWGMPGMYPFANNVNVNELLVEEILKVPEISRVVIRRDIRGIKNHSFDTEIIKKLLENAGKHVIWWEQFIGSSKLDFISNPEAIFNFYPQNPTAIFAFDSTFNLVAGYLGLESKLIWPSEFFIDKVLLTTRSKEFVREQIKIMQEVFKQRKDFVRKKEHLSISTNNSALASILSHFFIGEFIDTISEKQSLLLELKHTLTLERDALTLKRDALAQERDALAQERDALTLERDALTLERDALTLERDALTLERDALAQSTIWQLSKPIRFFVSKIKLLF